MPALCAFTFFMLWSNALLILWELDMFSTEFAISLVPTMMMGNLLVWMLLDIGDTQRKFDEIDREMERRHSEKMQKLIEELAEKEWRENYNA